MRIVQINTTCGIGSTGKICVGISRVLSANGIENYVLCSRSNGDPSGIICSDYRHIKIQALKSRFLGNYGFNNVIAARKMIAELERIKPDIVHLHNIHGHDCNIEVLFSYFKQKKTKLLWTFHDCWAFTAYCPHFTMMRCGKWRIQCAECVQKREFSWLIDRSKELYDKKRALFEGLDLTIITPSQWLEDLVKQSFLKDYPIHVIHNGIDLGIFKPYKSDFRKVHNLEDKKIILGVAFDWGKRKGLDVFIELADRLPDNYKIVLVGTNDTIDKKLPDRILSIHRTQNQEELAQIYTAADVFVNPTREENYPTVNMESLACGTPVLTFQTGGSPEMLDNTCGAVVACDDVGALLDEIIRICTKMPYTVAACLEKSREFDQTERFKEYLNIYEGIDPTGNSKG